MKRFSKKFNPKDLNLFKDKLLKWSNSFKVSTFLNSNNYSSNLSEYECICAVELESEIPYTVNNSTQKLDEYLKKVNDWVFGYINYDLKNEIENLKSNNPDNYNLPNLYFYQPKKIWIIRNDCIEALYLEPNSIFQDWTTINNLEFKNTFNVFTAPKLSQKLNKDQYLSKIELLKSHINRGDVYEANFCFEWFSENAEIDTLYVYQNLNRISKSPMSVYFKNKSLHLICSSPERYLKKQNTKLTSQPIKGTSRRDHDLNFDKSLKDKLKLDPKERSENIMIVDLVRNDMSRFSIPGSVKVKELCEVYPFEQVHQMISTIESQVESSLKIGKIIAGSFPMGSMTGAPKVKAMKIIDELEVTKRGLYSGAVGFIDPNGDFDFNVVIRSLIYDSMTKYLSFHVGSAITAKSKGTNEYEECLLKGKAMILSLT